MSLFVHVALIFSYSLLAALLGMRAPDWLGGTSTPLQGYLATTLLFLFFALLHEVLARRAAQVLLRAEIADFHCAEIERMQSIEDARREIEAVREEIESTQARPVDMALLNSLLGQIAARLPSGPVAAPAGLPMPDAGGTALRRETSPASLDELRAAIEDNRVDLYLQPIVSLPQRKTRHYECFSRIRTADGTLLAPAHYLAMAETAGLLTVIDNFLLLRCVQLIRRVRRRSRNVGFFVNMSTQSLEDGGFVEPFLEFLDQNPELADHIVLEFPAADFQDASPTARGVLLDLTDRRYRFSLDRVEQFDLNIAWFAARGVRFLKVEAARLLDPDLPDDYVRGFRAELDRHGVDLVAEKVETEAQVIELLDLRVDFGQGWLFGEPRRSREEP